MLACLWCTKKSSDGVDPGPCAKAVRETVKAAKRSTAKWQRVLSMTRQFWSYVMSAYTYKTGRITPPLANSPNQPETPMKKRHPEPVETQDDASPHTNYTYFVVLYGFHSVTRSFRTSLCTPPEMRS